MAKNPKDKMLLSLAPFETNLMKKCAISANLTYTEFVIRLISEKSFEYMNEIRALSGLSVLTKNKVLAVKVPAKRKVKKTNTNEGVLS